MEMSRVVTIFLSLINWCLHSQYVWSLYFFIVLHAPISFCQTTAESLLRTTEQLSNCSIGQMSSTREQALSGAVHRASTIHNNPSEWHFIDFILTHSWLALTPCHHVQTAQKHHYSKAHFFLPIDIQPSVLCAPVLYRHLEPFERRQWHANWRIDGSYRNTLQRRCTWKISSSRSATSRMKTAL